MATIHFTTKPLALSDDVDNI
ncbi:unnamed protein product [Kuraishia capsulata CBS 1993]|uniref:Uncharacterized protein n=1 Tax=Kuraishia capsulata CBS 1993 TaxID=1382522 RepID=W6MN09_9ASCO|nr:unnamed protein product [Kuraishia capsulata CBS 1993]